MSCFIESLETLKYESVKNYLQENKELFDDIQSFYQKTESREQKAKIDEAFRSYMSVLCTIQRMNLDLAFYQTLPSKENAQLSELRARLVPLKSPLEALGGEYKKLLQRLSGGITFKTGVLTSKTIKYSDLHTQLKAINDSFFHSLDTAIKRIDAELKTRGNAKLKANRNRANAAERERYQAKQNEFANSLGMPRGLRAEEYLEARLKKVRGNANWNVEANKLGMPRGLKPEEYLEARLKKVRGNANWNVEANKLGMPRGLKPLEYLEARFKKLSGNTMTMKNGKAKMQQVEENIRRGIANSTKPPLSTSAPATRNFLANFSRKLERNRRLKSRLGLPETSTQQNLINKIANVLQMPRGLPPRNYLTKLQTVRTSRKGGRFTRKA